MYKNVCALELCMFILSLLRVISCHGRGGQSNNTQGQRFYVSSQNLQEYWEIKAHKAVRYDSKSFLVAASRPPWSSGWIVQSTSVKYLVYCIWFVPVHRFSHSFPTRGQRAFLCTWSSWPSCSCWARQPSRPSPTTASTLPPGCTAPPRATSMHCASEAPTERSWRTRTRITSARCTTAVR